MKTFMKISSFAGLALAMTTFGAPQARAGGWAVAGGVLGGLAVGTAVGVSVASAAAPVYYTAPAPVLCRASLLRPCGGLCAGTGGSGCGSRLLWAARGISRAVSVLPSLCPAGLRLGNSLLLPGALLSPLSAGSNAGRTEAADRSAALLCGLLRLENLGLGAGRRFEQISQRLDRQFHHQERFGNEVVAAGE